MANQVVFPVPYAPQPIPTLPGGEANYLRKELKAIQETLRGVLLMLPQDASAAPSDPQQGMIRRAVAPWRPVSGQTTDRWVQYAGGAWAYFT